MPFVLPGQAMPNHIGRRRRKLRGVGGTYAPAPSGPPISVLTGLSPYVLRLRTKSTGTSLGNQLQGGVAGDKNRTFYEMRDIGGVSQISRYRLDGGIPQRSVDFMLPWSVLGHQGIGLSIAPDGSDLLWVSSDTNGQAVSFAYTAGTTPGAFNTYTLFDTTQQLTTCVSYDGRWLVARQGNVNKYRVFSLATLIAGGSGDYQAQFTYEFTGPPIIPGTDDTVQMIAMYDMYIYVLSGLTSGTVLKHLRLLDATTGRLLDENHAVTIGQADSLNSGSIERGGGTFWEPEALFFSSLDWGTRPILHVGTISGDQARRRTSYWQMASRSPMFVQKFVDKACVAMTVQPNDTLRKQMLTMVSDLDAFGVLERMALLYLGAVDDKSQSFVNLIDPGIYTLTEVSTAPTFVPNKGWRGNGVGYLETGANIGSLQNYDRARAHVASYLVESAATTAGAMVGSSVEWSKIAIGTGGTYDSRSNNGSAAVDSIAQANTRGMYFNMRVSTGVDADGGLYYKYRDNVLVQSPTNVYGTNDTATFRILKNVSETPAGSTMTVSMMSAGLDLTTSQKDAFHQIFATFLAARGA